MAIFLVVLIVKSIGVKLTVGTASGSNAWEVLGDNSAEPVLSKPQFDRFLGHAFLSLAQTSDLKMPWEVSGQPVDSSLLSKL